MGPEAGWKTVGFAAAVLGAMALSACSARVPADFYVAPNGNDASPGTFRKPFATLARAREAVRARVAAGLTRDVTVLIRGGTYWLAGGIAFGPEDSGTAEHAITYAAYPDERVRLVGGVKLTGWQAYSGSIRHADIPAGLSPRQVFENGTRVALARTPDRGYLGIEKPVEGKAKSAFVYRAGDLDPGDWDLDGAAVFIWPGHNWFSHTKPIAAVDPKARTITLGSNAGYPMRPGNRYFVQNALALLDRPGECCIAPKCRKVCLWPTAEPIDRQEIVISTAQSILAVGGDRKAGRIVRNLHFRDLDLSIADGDVVSFRDAEGCSIRFCKIENGGRNGVVLGGHSQRITLYGNLIRYHGLHGVELGGLVPGQADVNHRNVVENNHIHHCGRLVGHGYGVRISQSGHNRVVHNHIHHMPRYATTIKGTRYQVLRKQLKGVTWENRHDFLHSRNNLVAYNHIHHVNLDSQDTGALESWGPGRDNVYDHNLIHHVGNSRFNLQMGIYLDDATDHFTVTNNIIYNVIGAPPSQPIYAKGVGNKIRNNILIVAPTNRAAISSLYMAQERCDHHEYTRNIIYFEGPGDGRVLYDFHNWSDDRVARCDHNVYFRRQGKLSIKGGPADGSFEKWRQILDRKFDRHTVVADPMFVDPARRNYRLKPDSPARKLGFKDIDPRKIGLKEDFPRRFEVD